MVYTFTIILSECSGDSCTFEKEYIMKKKAFPYPKKDGSSTSGMDLRDYFAAKSIQGILAREDCTDIPALANKGYEIADAMLKKRQQRSMSDIEL